MIVGEKNSHVDLIGVLKIFAGWILIPLNDQQIMAKIQKNGGRQE